MNEFLLWDPLKSRTLFAIRFTVCIMMHSMMKNIYFLLDERWHAAGLPDAAEAVRAYREYGFSADLWIVGGEEDIADAGIDWPERDTLCVADSERLLGQLLNCGAAYCAYSHAGNKGEDLHSAEYILMEPQWVDQDSLVKIWQRQRDLPWTILETERCIVREFVMEDLDAIYELYDKEAARFLETPCSDRNKEREILKSYINRVYRLGGYGDWAVISKETGELIGRMGFSFPSASAPEPVPDVSFGYLVHAGWRGRGITREVGTAILQYGFCCLGFESIGADADVSNAVSVKILQYFGFKPVAQEKDQRYYRLIKKDWETNTDF